MLREEFPNTIQRWRGRGSTPPHSADHPEISVRALQNWGIASTVPESYGLNAQMAEMKKR